MNTKMNHKSRLFTLLLALVLALAPAFSLSQPVQAEVIPCMVTSDADSGDGTLRAWLADATCSTITFADNYKIHLTSTLVIDSNRTVTIDGVTRTVTISGDSTNDGSADLRLFEIASGSNVSLQNLSITKGFDDGDTSGDLGGAIRNNGELSVLNSSITGSSAYVGGGIYNGGTLTVSGSTFTDNSAVGGGAIYNDAYLSYNPNANVTVTGSTFSHNTSIWDGPSGGLSVFVGLMGGGSAIANFMGTLEVTGSTFSGNTANYLGGAIASAGGSTVTNSTFNGNAATGMAGAIFTYWGTLTNNTFANNAAPDGSTLVFYDDSSFPMTLHNNLLVRGGTGANCSIYHFDGGTPGGVAGSSNLADDDSCGTGFTNIPTLSTQIGTLGDNGGSTQTIPLLEGSPAIDTGGDASCPANDQRGVTRPQGAHCDVGAYEYEPPFEVTEKFMMPEPSLAGYPILRTYVYFACQGVQSDYACTVDYGDGTIQIGRVDGRSGGQFICSDEISTNHVYQNTGTYTLIFNIRNLISGAEIAPTIQHEVTADPDPGSITWTPNPVPENGSATFTTALDGYDSYGWYLVSGPGIVPDLSQPVGYAQSSPISFGASGTYKVMLVAFTMDSGTGAITSVADGAEVQVVSPQPLQYGPDALPDGNLNAAYSQTITVNGGIAPYTFRNGSEGWLPDGMTLDTSSGNIVIAGTPTEAGQVLLDVYVMDQTGTEIEIQYEFWIKTDPSLTLASSLNPSLQGQEVTFSLGSTATVTQWPAPWGQVTFFADGAVISGCDGQWMGYDWNAEQPAPNPVMCNTSALAVGSHEIMAALTTIDGPYNRNTVILQGGQTVNAEVSNTAPRANPGGPYLGAINTDIAFDGSASSDPEGDILTYTWEFGDSGTGSGVAPAHSYTTPDIYNVCLTVNDGMLDSDPSCIIAVVYDPSGGFVTGGGWILSPAGAYTADPSLEGKATFGFVSKYKKGASVPTGNTSFAFDLAGFEFYSDSYEWLVVNQAGTNAQFKGSGTVNGTLDPNGNPYKFMLWASDGSPDTFRIKIWWEEGDVEHVVYDNGFEGSTYEVGQPIGAGNIVVHKGK